MSDDEIHIERILPLTNEEMLELLKLPEYKGVSFKEMTKAEFESKYGKPKTLPSL